MKCIVKAHKGKHLTDIFPIHNCLKKGDALSQMFFSFPWEYASGGSTKPGGTEIKCDTSVAGLN
jgi:hypothetical protein